jgi:enamine deaminase RidA (YjgF/YER057c/UK114 family)
MSRSARKRAQNIARHDLDFNESERMRIHKAALPVSNCRSLVRANSLANKTTDNHEHANQMGCCNSAPERASNPNPQPNPLAGGRITRRLKELGLELPETAVPVANYNMSTLTPSKDGATMTLSLAGHIDKSGPLGKVAAEPKEGFVTVEQAKTAARAVVLNMFATINRALDGDMDGRLLRFVKITVFVNCAADFAQHPVVANGASDLLVEILGEDGRHARAAVGMNSLPLNVCVEIDAVVEVAPKKK